MLSIIMDDETLYEWRDNEYTDLSFVDDYNVFLVSNNGKWIGLYNMASVSAIEVRDES